MDEHKFMNWDSSLSSANLILIDPPCNVQRCRENAKSHYDVTSLDSIADTNALFKW